MSVDFQSIQAPPPDAIFSVRDRFNADPSPNKVNLIIGAYRCDKGKPWKLPSVRMAEKILSDKDINHEYLEPIGDPEFLKASQKVVFGEEWLKHNSSRVVTVQSLSGTGALRLGCEFFKRFLPGRKVYISNPTWPIHQSICTDAGLEWTLYPYYDEKTRGLDYTGLIQTIKEAPNGSIILLHAVAHNPTGVDPTPEQWRGISDVVREKQHVTLFDSAYQGFASGDLEKDAYAIRLWNELGLDFFLAQSYAKNFGLYGERVGCFHVVLPHPDYFANVSGQLARIIRAMYSNPPSTGSNIVKTVVNDPVLFQQWKDDLKTMSSRLYDVRHKLYNALLELGTPGDWKHIINQIGMFTYTGLTGEQVDAMSANHHIYMVRSGRISLAGLNSSNIEHVAQAIHFAVTQLSKV